MLHEGDRVPHFDVTTIDGARVSYADVWQRRNLVLLCLPDGERARQYADKVTAAFIDLTDDVLVVATGDELPGLSAPSVLVADKWGEVYNVTAAPGVDDLPAPAQVVDWVQFVRHECPECQGESR
jgi:hypothetical protein